MDSRTPPSHSVAALTTPWLQVGTETDAHIIDRLINERSTHLSQKFYWPVLRPILLRFLHYKQAIRMADEVGTLSGWDAMQYLSRLLDLDVTVEHLDRVPEKGAFILAPSHPTGIADGVAVFDALKERRADMAIFANRDAIRVIPRLDEIVIPVEWRQHEKSHSKSRDTLVMTARAFQDGRAVVLFPSGRIASWKDGALTERPWQASVVSLAKRFNCPVVPVHLSARNSGLFYFLARFSTELRDMTLFHELLNKEGRSFHLRIGKPIDPSLLNGDPADVTVQLQKFTVETLKGDADAEFQAVARK
ncbi:GNAT family N-acetyltransferase [Limoniibacter endophyticus]|uniref:Acyltransferase n=1 Tax=Limoniibacter endophyticus TaxID=1565040 RepID=A0A8J3DNE9_9HYPH|nr:1-acyl-sn-glycerol-3-phosphate acyltransferase [Limoniibacter endophyticus]GHC73842.1 acyltransferase [Limoniibacter endophyticus]